MKIKLRGILIIIIMVVCIIAFAVHSINFGDQNVIEADISVTKPPEEDLFKAILSSYSNDSLSDNKTKITLTANGDVMFHTSQINGAYNGGNYNFDSSFNAVKKYIENADIAMANFESTTGGGSPSGYPMFNAPDEVLQALSKAGYDILSTANNHCLDTGKSGLIRTINKIHENDMVNVGTYQSPGEHIYIADVKGIKLAVLSYTYGLNGMDNVLSGSEREYMVNLINEDRIQNDIQQSKNLGADMTVVFIHWGTEYQLTPSTDQTRLAQEMFNWGADIILGSHPHVVQRSEMVNINGDMKYVIYSMGNFISNQRRETLGSINNSEYTEDGVIVNITLEKDSNTGKTKILNVQYVPTWVDRQMVNGSYQYQVLPVGNTENVSGNTKSKMNQSYINTMSRMESYRDFGD